MSSIWASDLKLVGWNPGQIMFFAAQMTPFLFQEKVAGAHYDTKVNSGQLTTITQLKIQLKLVFTQTI